MAKKRKASTMSGSMKANVPVVRKRRGRPPGVKNRPALSDDARKWMLNSAAQLINMAMRDW